VYNELGPAEKPYLRTKGHRNTSVSGDTRADWAEAFALVPSLTVGYVWHADKHTGTVAAGLQRIGFELVCLVVWDKGQFAMGRSWYDWGHEPCWVVRRARSKAKFLGPRDQSTVWRAPSPKMIMAGSAERKEDHPAQKPLALFETPIQNHLRPGESVYDPFLGSGTALIAAERSGVACYALEIDPLYVEVALRRWERFSGLEAVRLDD
jgi:DNA modification methylase